MPVSEPAFFSFQEPVRAVRERSEPAFPGKRSSRRGRGELVQAESRAESVEEELSGWIPRSVPTIDTVSSCLGIRMIDIT